MLRVHEKIRAAFDRIPEGIPDPWIVGRGINDVPILVLTISAKPERASDWNDNGLYQVAEELQHELTKVEGVGQAFIDAGSPSEIRVEPDPEKLTLHDVTLEQLICKVQSANRAFLAGAFRENGKAVPVVVGQTLQGGPDIGFLLITTPDGRPVYVKDVAKTVVGYAEQNHRAWTMTRDSSGKLDRRPTVSLAIAKRKGENAVNVAANALKRLELVMGSLAPASLDVEVTRDYGATANEKANELLFHLALATGSIVLLIVVTIGWLCGLSREQSGWRQRHGVVDRHVCTSRLSGRHQRQRA